MLDFLKSLLKGRQSTATTLDQTDMDEVSADLSALETVAPGLSKRAINYVFTGDGGSVLLEIEQRQQAALNALSENNFQNRDKEGIKARRRLLTRPHGPDADWLRRYGEVLCTAVAYSAWHWGLGTEHRWSSPGWLRFLLTVGCNASGKTALSLCAPFDAMLGWCDPDENPTLVALDILILETLTHAFAKRMGRNFYDFDRHLPEQAASVIDAYLHFDKPGQTALLDLLRQFGLVSGRYFDFIYEQFLATTSKHVREAAQNALSTAPPELLTARIGATLDEGSPAARVMVVQLLPVVLQERARPLLEAHLAKEKAKSVRKVIELALVGPIVPSKAAASPPARTLTEDGPAGYLAADGTEVLAPQIVAPPGASPVSERIRASYRKLLERAYETEVKNFERRKEFYDKQPAEQRARWAGGPPKPPAPVDVATADRYCDTLAATDTLVNHPTAALPRVHAFSPWFEAAVAAPPFTDAELTLWHLARAFGLQQATHFRGVGNILSGASAIGAAIRARLVEGLDLRSLEILLPPPVEARAIARNLLSVGDAAARYDLPEELIWPLLCGNFDLLDQALGLVPAKLQVMAVPRQALELIQVFPKLPARYFVTVLGHAIGTQKIMSAPARALLLKLDGVQTHLLPHLQDGKQEVRVGVAAMLGSLGDPTAIKPLQHVLAKEKSELARAAFLGALKRLGADISGYLTPDTLVKEAEAGLKAKKVKDIAWFPFDALPALSWRSGGRVPAEVLRWWLLLAAKLAQPGSNALFQLWLDQLEPAGAEALGRFVLASWFGYDTVHCPESEANAYAQAHAQGRYDQYQRYAKQFKSDFFASYTYERAFADLRREKLGVYFNNAYGERGVLGLAVRADATQAVASIRAYMRDHRARTAQLRALTEFLAGHPSSSALQYLLSIARRHRTKQIQALAAELVERIADERDWTAEELADRTVPTAGLDERGVLELPIGDRVYELKLEADDSLALYNPAGKVVQALPQIKDGPEKDSAAEAKALLTTAKKELKQVYEFQAKRLYEALCVSRRWPAADWRRYLLEHPLIGRLAQRVIWLGLDAAGDVRAVFRPMEDLSLTDPDDNEVSLDGIEQVQLAHRSLLTAEAAEAWRQHLKDYKVALLFEQLKRPLFSGEAGTALEDRRGHVLEAFKLRGAAQKLGYERSQAVDGGWFTEYLKPFTSIGITAVIGFTGSPLPEENREVALTETRFLRVSGKKRAGYGRYMALSDVPPVLLSEVWNDLHQIAAAGRGFDPDWQKRAAY